MRECECERVPKRTYINYLLLLLEGGIERTTGTSERENYHTQLERRSSKETSGCENLLNTKSKKITRELKKKQLVRKLITHSTIHNYLMPC